MADTHPGKPKIHPGDPIDPRPGYGRIKPHFLLAGIVMIGLGAIGYFHLIGSILLGLLFLVWSVDNDYFDFGG